MCSMFTSLEPSFCLHLGNKCDLEQERQVQFEEACNMAKNGGILATLETSAKVRIRLRKHRGETGQDCCLKFLLSASR